MAKANGAYFCKECGYESQGWLGKCPACNEWNSLVAAPKESSTKSKVKAGTKLGWLSDANLNIDSDNADNIISFDKIGEDKQERFSSGISDLDLVLGGGLVRGSLVLVGGDPGIGKSTLLLQLCNEAQIQAELLYVCGEESPAQIKIRANRLGVSRKGLKLLPETCFEKIANAIVKLKPALVVIDSIQTIYSENSTSTPGSVSQIRDCTAGFLRIAKALNITILLIGHVTKDGAIAGPRLLEHMVDTVLYFEGGHTNLRLIRSIKNRFGRTDEVGVFAMKTKGLIPVSNPSEMLLAGRPLNVSGSVITATLEGSRPFLIEIQALLARTNFAVPQRMTQGVDRNRIAMLMAVANKYLNLNFEDMDAYVNVVGGLKISDPGADLAVLVALISSLRNQAVSNHTMVLGELGLTGELRPVSLPERKMNEGKGLGFKQLLIPSGNRSAFKDMNTDPLDLIFVDNLGQAIDILFS